MKKKNITKLKSRIFVCVLLVVFLFAALSWAWVPAAIVLGTVLRTSSGVIISHVVRNQLAYSVLGGLLTGLGYIAYDRGVGVDPAKRYVNVPLTESRAAVGAQKEKILSENPLPQWATSVITSYVVQGDDSKVYTYTSVPSGSMACKEGISVVNGQWEFLEYAVVVVSAPVYSYGVPTPRAVVCTPILIAAFPDVLVKDKIYTNTDLKKYYQEALGRDLSKSGIVESASPASNSMIINMGGDVYETNNYTDARNMIESGVIGETTRDAEIIETGEGTQTEVEPLPPPTVSDGSCGDYVYRNNWDIIKTNISSGINALPLYGLINKLADLTGQSGFPHQYHLDLSAVGFGSADLDLDAFYFVQVLAVIRWAVLAGGFILAWRIAVGGD